MTRCDLAARPIYHPLNDSIEAHLTIEFTALAIVRDLQARSGYSAECRQLLHKASSRMSVGFSSSTTREELELID